MRGVLADLRFWGVVLLLSLSVFVAVAATGALEPEVLKGRADYGEPKPLLLPYYLTPELIRGEAP